MSDHQHQLFLDLDGVLADFERGVKRSIGRYPHQLSASRMWNQLRRTKDFFTHLPWTPDGRELWEATQHHNPPIHTGLPHDGDWAAQQKREWCTRELGEDVTIITCLARHKIDEAFTYLTSNQIPILIDDRTTHQKAWEAQGGIYIVHRSTQESLAELARIIHKHS